MSVVFLFLFGVALIGVGYAGQELITKRREQSDLRDRLGSEYDEYIARRKRKRKA